MKNRVLAYLTAIPALTLGIVYTTYAASGIALSSAVVTGARDGLAEAAASIEGTVNNQFFITLAVMFIGFAVVVGFLQTMVRGHRRI